MKILALECSAKRASAALRVDGELAAYFLDESNRTHSETLLFGAEKMLKKAHLDFTDIDMFAVTGGPGSFTGLRIGLAAVKGLAFLKKPCVELSTLKVIAAGVLEDGIICAVMDARRNQFYNALFKREKGFLERITGDRAISGDDLNLELKNYSNVIIAGDGAELFCKTHKGYKFSGVYQDAKVVALLAEEKQIKPVFAESLYGNYLRRSQAERVREEKSLKD